MPTMIPSAQLEAITRLELAAEALAKALRAVQHPDLNLAGGAIIAPSGLKHLAEITSTAHDLTQAIRPVSPAEVESEPPPTLQELLLSDDESALVDRVTVGLAAALRTSMQQARAQLAQHPSFQADLEFTGIVLQAALAGGSRLGYRIFQFLDAAGTEEPSAT
ncbi:hypothetical protein [Microbacterium sp.]|uniref:hypothetical protein n=1 Tax=Microbacterium sp. TaxID=51671 RepID=UPI0039E5C93A